MQSLPSHSDDLATAGSAEIRDIFMPDTARLAAAVNALPTGEYREREKSLSIHRDPASSIGPAYVDFHLTSGDNKLIVIVGCPKEGPQLARIVLWKGDKWDIALQTNLAGWEPHNHGVTQMQVDAITADIENLAASIKGHGEISPDISKGINDKTHGTLNA